MASQNKTSILLPSAYRAMKLIGTIDMLLDSVGNQKVEILVSVVSDDYASQNITRNLPVLLDVRSVGEYERGAIYAWNKLARRATGDVLALWADDLMPEPGWLDRALAYLDVVEGGLVGFNDLYSNGNEYAAHWLASRRFLVNVCGGVMYPPHYTAWWADREWTDRAKALGQYVWASDAVVEHRNYTFGVSELDDTYRAAQPYYAADEATYKTRKAAGFPNDYQAVML